MLDARTCAMIFAVPLADDPLKTRLKEYSNGELSDGLRRWIVNSESAGWLVAESIDGGGSEDVLTVNLRQPVQGYAVFHIRPNVEATQRILQEASQEHTTSTCHIFVCPDESSQYASAEFDLLLGVGSGGVLLLPDAWTAALVIEQMRPLLFSDLVYEEDWSHGAAASLETSYFSADMEGELDGSGVDVSRSAATGRGLANILLEDETSYEEKLRQLKEQTPSSEGTILLASVFLPPVTHSLQAVKRFYGSRFGIRQELVPLIEERYAWERQMFESHVTNFARIDIVDRGVLTEYLSAPEYYQMPLTVEELRQQIENVLALLTYPNYTVCLCPEAIDLSFEIRGGKLRIRTDRRNKGQPRQGRVSSLSFAGEAIAEVFEREFWSLYRLTEEQFKDRDHVGEWLVNLASAYKGPAHSA